MGDSKGFSKIRGTILRVPIIRTVVFCGLYWGSPYSGIIYGYMRLYTGYGGYVGVEVLYFPESKDQIKKKMNNATGSGVMYWVCRVKIGII